MSNNVNDKIKPFGTLRDFGAGHLGHYETLLYGHCLGPFGTLRDFFLGHYKPLWKNFLRVLRTPPPRETSKNFLRALWPPTLLESWKNSPSFNIDMENPFGCHQQSGGPLNASSGFETIEAPELIIVKFLGKRKQQIPLPM